MKIDTVTGIITEYECISPIILPNDSPNEINKIIRIDCLIEFGSSIISRNVIGRN